MSSRCMRLSNGRLRGRMEFYAVLVLWLALVPLCLSSKDDNMHDTFMLKENEGIKGIPIASDALVVGVMITFLITLSIAFEVSSGYLKDSTDDMNMPFVNTAFSDLTTLGFIGLILYIATKIELFSYISSAAFGHKEKIVEAVEELHMGLFLFILVFLLLCCALLRLGTQAQNEWREFERNASDIPIAISAYTLATETPRSWKEYFSLHRYLRARKARRELTYLALRKRFLDYRSNHPDPGTAHSLAKEFQLNAYAPFPFNEYLSIIYGGMMAKLIELDAYTWIGLEVTLVVSLAICSALGTSTRIWVLMVFGLALIAMNRYVYKRIYDARTLLTPPAMLMDAERLRRKNEWRSQFMLPLYESNEQSHMLESVQISEVDFTPPYLELLPGGGYHLSEAELQIYQRKLVGGRGDGAKLTIFLTRLLFLLTAMHLSIFLMQTMSEINKVFSSILLRCILYTCFLLPTILVTSLSTDIARDVLYAFNVEHLKSARVMVTISRLVKARQTLRTLRCIAEMKIYLREALQREKARGFAKHVLPITASLHASSSMYSTVFSPKNKRKGGNSSRQISPARRSRAKRSESYISSLSSSNTGSRPISPLSSYTSPRHRQSDAYQLEMERRDIHAIFCLFDVDGSGTVSREEMRTLLEAITYHVDEADLTKLMKELTGGDDEQDDITFEAFYNWCLQRIHQSTRTKEDLIEEVFRLVDADGSGYITVEEFISIFKTLGQAIEADDVRELVYQMDRNDDNRIDLDEFKKMLYKHEV